MFKKTNIMKTKKHVLLPGTKAVLSELGENIKLARLRRKLTAQQVADRANISRATLWAIEKGSESVAIGGYAQVLNVLKLEKDFLMVGRDDVLGHKLQDAGLLPGKRGRRRTADDT